MVQYNVITRKNYFAHNKDIVIQYNSLAMGAPSSGLIAKIFLQHIEHTHSGHLTHKHRIINYCQYLDNILLIFDSNHTSIRMVLDDFNSLHPKLQFTAEAERDHTLNCLDISIHRTPTNIKTAIYVQEAHIHGHHHPLHLQPPRTPQIRSSRVPIQQTRLLQPTTRRIPT